MLVDCGETDEDELKGLMSEGFVEDLKSLKSALFAEYKTASCADDLKDLAFAIGEYLVTNGHGTDTDKADFVEQTVKIFSRWPQKIVLAAMKSAAVECPWPRDLASWMDSIVTIKLRMAVAQRNNVDTLLKIWGN